MRLSMPAVWLAPQGDFVGDYQDSPLLLLVNRYALQLQGILRGPNLCESPLDSCAAGEQFLFAMGSDLSKPCIQE